MPDMSYDLPLCGEYLRISMPSIPGVPSKELVAPPIPCGFYSMNMEMPTREFSIPALSAFMNPGAFGMSSPFPMPSPDMIPSTSFTTHVEMLHKDGSKIMDVEYKGGMRKE